jgi:GNAT superfamily N-acetyltransferase
MFVAEASGRLIGLAKVYLRKDDPQPHVVAQRYEYVQSLVVLTAFRRQGLGKQLMAAAERWPQEQGARKLRLSAWEFSEGLIPFYQSMGYSTYKRWMIKAL